MSGCINVWIRADIKHIANKILVFFLVSTALIESKIENRKPRIRIITKISENGNVKIIRLASAEKDKKPEQLKHKPANDATSIKLWILIIRVVLRDSSVVKRAKNESLPGTICLRKKA